MKLRLILLFLFHLITQVLNVEPEEEIINLEDTKKSLPSPEDEEIFYIPILHTNDMHGSFYPKKILLPNNNNTYTIGGLEYMGKYASIMLEKWNDRFLYFDTGDQFQGGIEGYISKGEIIMDFLNKMNVKKSVVGNHEFDYDIPFLKEYMEKANFDWIIDNIKNKTSGSHITFPKQKKSMIIYVDDVKDNYKFKLGIIGLATQETIASTSTKIDDLLFEDYIKTINEQSKYLKSQGADAIIVIGHLGLYCRNDTNEVKLEYRLRDKNLEQGTCRETDEAYKLLKNLEKGVIDLFLAGHRHDVTHNWVFDFPIMSNDRNGKYAQIVYLPFDRKSKKLLNDKILMEGPLPICEKIFKNTKICDLSVITKEDYDNYGELLHYKFHNKLIEKEPKITEIANKYLDLFNEYDKDFLTVTYEHFEASKERETNLADFYCDFLRQISGADIALLNGGAFRTPLYRGNITSASIYSFDPFNNSVVLFKASGRDIIRICKQIQMGDKGFYPFSGLKMTLRSKPSRKLLSIKLWDGYKEEEIDENKMYSVVSNNFCFPLDKDKVGGDDYEKVYQWFRPNGKYLEIDGYQQIREILIEYLRNIKQLKSSKYYDEDNLRMRIVDND